MDTDDSEENFESDEDEQTEDMGTDDSEESFESHQEEQKEIPVDYHKFSILNIYSNYC